MKHSTTMAAESDNGWWLTLCLDCPWSVEVEVSDCRGLVDALQRVYRVRDDHEMGLDQPHLPSADLPFRTKQVV